MPPLKELHFFDRIDAGEESMHERQRARARKHMRGLADDDANRAEWKAYLRKVTIPDTISDDWYRDLFSWPTGADVVKGEITPAYLEISEKSVRYARELLGPVKIVVVVRRPLQRTLSQLRMWAERRKDYDGLDAEAIEEWGRIYKRMVRRESRGGYSNIPTWIDAFGADNVLALPFGDVRDAPADLLARIEDFLGISRFGQYADLEKKSHASKKAEIPEQLIGTIAESVADEDLFLQSYFGKEFFARTL